MNSLKAVSLALLLCVASVAASAQEPDIDQLVQAGAQAAQMVDNGRGEELWEGGSATLKKRVGKRELVNNLKAIRAGDGSLVERRWSVIERQVVANSDAAAPPGEYVNVRFVARLRNRSLNELVTFRHDEDGVWRWTGYSLN